MYDMWNPQAGAASGTTRVAGPNDIVDVQFALKGAAVVQDYADFLWQSLQQVLPWLAEDLHYGVHPLSGLSPGHLPDGAAGWNLSRRSRLSLRIPRHRVEATQELAGARLAIGSELIEVGQAQLRELAYSPVLYAKFVTFAPAGERNSSESDFMAGCLAQFDLWNIRPQMICGKVQHARAGAGWLSGFSLLLAGLERDMNLRLQHDGMGGERRHGCGIFVPHKTFTAVTLE